MVSTVSVGYPAGVRLIWLPWALRQKYSNTSGWQVWAAWRSVGITL